MHRASAGMKVATKNTENTEESEGAEAKTAMGSLGKLATVNLESFVPIHNEFRR